MPTPQRTGTSTAQPEQQAAGSLPVASLLAFTGGLLDAFLYLEHGHVFAGAMTGNVVLCGIALSTGSLPQIAQHGLPVAAFFTGIWLSETLQTHLRQHHAVLLCLSVEAAGLLVASFLPRGFPDPAFVFVIALLAAFQVGTFGKADKLTYSSTYVTGDLRTFAIGVYQAFQPQTHTEGQHQRRTLGTILGCFSTGAVTGGLLSHRLGNHTLWLPVVTLSVVLVLLLRGPHREAAATATSSAGA